MTVKTAQNQSNYVVNTPLSGTTYSLPGYGAVPSFTIQTVGGGGGGGAGSVLTNSSNSIVMPQSNFTAFNSGIKITPQDGGEAIIETNHSKINLDQLHKMTTELFGIVYEDKALHDKHPTLADVYERWQVAYRRTVEKIQIDPEQRELYKEYQSLKAILTAE